MIESHPIVSREQWLAMRLRDVTASDVGAVCGVDPRSTPLQIYAEKTGLIPPRPENQLLRRGRWLEDAAIAAIREERPDWLVSKPAVYLRDPQARIGATPDLFAIDPERSGQAGIVQIKVVARPVFRSDWGDEPPLAYQIQTLTEAKLAGADWAAIAALVIDTYAAELVLIPVRLDDGAWERIRETVRRFWMDVESGRRPAVDPRRDAETVAALHPRETGAVLDLSGDNYLTARLSERAAAKARIAADEALVAEIDTEIKAKLGEASEASLNGWRIAWRTQRRPERITPAWEGRVLRIADRRTSRGAAA